MTKYFTSNTSTENVPRLLDTVTCATPVRVISGLAILIVGGTFSNIASCEDFAVKDRGAFIEINGKLWTKVIDLVDRNTAVQTCQKKIEGKSGWRLPLVSEIDNFAANNVPFNVAINPGASHNHTNTYLWVSDVEKSATYGYEVSPRLSNEERTGRRVSIGFKQRMWMNQSDEYDLYRRYRNDPKLGAVTCVRDDVSDEPLKKDPPNAVSKIEKLPVTRASVAPPLLSSNSEKIREAERQKELNIEKSTKQEKEEQMAAERRSRTVPIEKPVVESSQLLKLKHVTGIMSAASAKNWCSTGVTEFRKNMATGPNKIMSVGNCSCKAEGISNLLNSDYTCSFTYTEQRFVLTGK